MTCPSKKSSEPKASHKNTIEVDDETDGARGNDRGDQPPSRQRRIDCQIGELRQKEGDTGSENEVRRREQRRSRGSEKDGDGRYAGTEPALHEVT